MIEAERERYRRELEERQAELENDLRQIEAIAAERAPDVMDDLVLASERDLAVAKLGRATSLLAEVRAALERIAGGGYGRCRGCSREITAARLRALPWASYCRRCQEAIDSHWQDRVTSRTRILREAA